MFKARRPCDTGQLHAIPLGDGLRGRIIIRWRRAPTIESVSLLVAIGVNNEGSREIPGICEGAKEDKSGWSEFLKHLKERGLKGVRLITSDACIGLVSRLRNS